MAKVTFLKSSNSQFKQQTLAAWHPFFSAANFFPIFYFIGILYIPIGLALLALSNRINEHVIDYTNCEKLGDANSTCLQYLMKNPSSSCECKMHFHLPRTIKKDVYFYYGLTNFYQNHRLYVKSRDDEQLLGRLSDQASNQCYPFLHDGNKTIVPCGAIANSMFNDSFTLDYAGQPVTLLKTGIVWPSDKKKKFQNPSGNLRAALANYAKPRNWQKELWELDESNNSNNGLQNEDFVVWMRNSVLPSFRKLYRRVDHTAPDFSRGLQSGNYTLNVLYQYPVVEFQGTKTIVLSNTSLMGGKNSFLGIAFVVYGCICIVLASVLVFLHTKFHKKVSDVLAEHNLLVSSPGQI